MSHVVGNAHVQNKEKGKRKAKVPERKREKEGQEQEKQERQKRQKRQKRQRQKTVMEEEKGVEVISQQNEEVHDAMDQAWKQVEGQGQMQQDDIEMDEGSECQ